MVKKKKEHKKEHKKEKGHKEMAMKEKMASCKK